MHNKASEQFDEDDNVLLKTIQEADSETNLDLITEVINGIDTYQGQVINNTLDYGITNNETNISSGVLSYPYNEDNTFYFQIYIPYINQVDLNSMPVIAPEMDEDNDCKILGYQLNANGTVSVIELTESYASTHLVWIVSINETVDNNGTQRLSIHKQETEKTHERGFFYKEVFFNKIRISDKKECWLCGKAEVSFLAAQTQGCGVSFNDPEDSKPMKKVGNSDLNNWIVVSGGASIVSHILAYDPAIYPGHGFFDETEFLHYLVYEKDAGTIANTKKVKWSNDYSSVTLSNNQLFYGSVCGIKSNKEYSYYSKDSPYWVTDNDLPVPYHELPSAASNTVWSNSASVGSGSGGQFQIMARRAYW